MKSQSKKPSKRGLRDADLGVVTWVLRLRLKDKHAILLLLQAKEVDFVWNYTQECSACGSRSGPKGLEGLGVASWLCSCCGAWHDRNQNAAQNILVAGLLEISKENALKVKSKFMSAEAKACEAGVNKDSKRSTKLSVVASGAGHGPLEAGILVL